jgi:predicted P-loop ATPase
MASLKSAMTQKTVTLRLPYAHFDETYTRISSFVACANDIQILPDVTGSRRWLCVECDNIKYDKLTPQLIRGAYAQARGALDAGFKAWFDRNDIAELTARNERFQAANHEEEIIKTLFEPAEKNAVNPQLMTTTEIFNCMSVKYPAIKFSSKKLGQTLRKLHFRRVVRTSDRLYAYALYKKSEC